MNRSNTPEYWDSRAEDFLKYPAVSRYENIFLAMADIREGETVFDMGCASGTLALPLAEEGHRVLACDFSRGMIEALKGEATRRHLEGNITAKLLDWNEDWSDKGLEPCDVAISSRSFFAADAAMAVSKLNSMALRKVIITAATEFSTKWNYNVGKAIGFNPEVPGYLKITEVLDSMGIEYGLGYIEEEDKGVTFSDKESCIDKLRNGFPAELSPEEDSKLNAYVNEHYSDGRLDVKWPVKWAFISWEK